MTGAAAAPVACGYSRSSDSSGPPRTPEPVGQRVAPSVSSWTSEGSDAPPPRSREDPARDAGRTSSCGPYEGSSTSDASEGPQGAQGRPQQQQRAREHGAGAVAVAAAMAVVRHDAVMSERGRALAAALTEREVRVPTRLFVLWESVVCDVCQGVAQVSPAKRVRCSGVFSIVWRVSCVRCAGAVGRGHCRACGGDDAIHPGGGAIGVWRRRRGTRHRVADRVWG